MIVSNRLLSSTTNPKDRERGLVNLPYISFETFDHEKFLSGFVSFQSWRDRDL